MNLIRALVTTTLLVGAWLTFFSTIKPAPVKAQAICAASAVYDASTNGATKLVTGSTTQKILVCGFSFFSGGTVNVSLVYGTGTNCGTGQNQITPAFEFTAQTGLVDHLPIYGGLKAAPLGNDLCILTSAGTAVQAIVYYDVF